jgi:hypothetical protein
MYDLLITNKISKFVTFTTVMGLKYVTQAVLHTNNVNFQKDSGTLSIVFVCFQSFPGTICGGAIRSAKADQEICWPGWYKFVLYGEVDIILLFDKKKTTLQAAGQKLCLVIICWGQWSRKYCKYCKFHKPFIM